MPVYPCRHPICSAYVQRRGDYCAEHQQQGKRERRERDRHYDQHVRDPVAKQFYNSAAWKRARETKLANNPVCERCEKAWARHVHHVKKLRDCTPAERVDQRILMAVCPPCHNAIEAEMKE